MDLGERERESGCASGMEYRPTRALITPNLYAKYQRTRRSFDVDPITRQACCVVNRRPRCQSGTTNERLRLDDARGGWHTQLTQPYLCGYVVPSYLYLCPRSYLAASLTVSSSWSAKRGAGWEPESESEEKMSAHTFDACR